MDEDAIRTLVGRLSRPHKSGGKVIERAAILAAGADSRAVLSWISDHEGEPEVAAPSIRGRGGLHSGQLQGREEANPRPPARYVLPPGTFR